MFVNTGGLHTITDKIEMSSDGVQYLQYLRSRIRKRDGINDVRIHRSVRINIPGKCVHAN
jgi:hypothetical protein